MGEEGVGEGERGRRREGEKTNMYIVLCCLVGEICAILSMDNREVGRTKWSSPGNKAWEQQFKIELDRVSIISHQHTHTHVMNELLCLAQLANSSNHYSYH